MGTLRGQLMSADVDEFYRYFVSLAEKIPEVREVRLTDPDYAPRIWTVIRAEPFDNSKTDPVYRAEMAALIAFPDVRVDFRLVNLAEWIDDSEDQIIPSSAKIL